MRKQSVLTAVVLLSLSGCSGNTESAGPTPTPAPESASTSPSPVLAKMIEVRGMSLGEAQTRIKNLPGFQGRIDLKYNPAAGTPSSQDANWIVVDTSPWAGFAISGGNVAFTVAMPEAPADKAPIFDSVTQVGRAIGAADVQCESGQPASQAQYPDEALNCTKDIVLGYWTLKTEKSKAFFEAQKKSYAQKTEGSSSLVGPNWTVNAPTSLVTKMQKVLGGTVL